MGTCGCSDTAPNFQFPGPKGVVYAIQYYGGCSDCGTGQGVILYRFDARDEEDKFWVQGVPKLKFHAYTKGEITGERFLHVLDIEKTEEALTKGIAEAFAVLAKDEGFVPSEFDVSVDIDVSELIGEALDAGKEAAFNLGWSKP